MFGLLLAAWSGERGIGLPSESTPIGGTVEILYEIGAVGSFLAAGQFLVGVVRGLRDAESGAD